MGTTTEPVHHRLAQDQQDWLESIAQIIRGGISEGHLRADVDPEQFAFELQGVLLSYHHASRLMADSRAQHRATLAFADLLARAHPPALTH